MTLYEVDQKIEEMIANAIDPDTGEILVSDEEIEALKMERDKKVENIALYIKNQEAMASAIREEEKALASRRRTCENRVERLKEYLKTALAGTRFQTARCDIRFRKSSTIEIGSGFIEWAEANHEDFLRYKAPEVDKTAVAKAIKNNEIVPFAGVVEKLGVTVK